MLLRRLNRPIDRFLSKNFHRYPRIQYGDTLIEQRSDLTVQLVGQAEISTPQKPRIPFLELPQIVPQFRYEPPYIISIQSAIIRGRHAAVFTQAQELVMESVLSRTDILALTSFGRIYYPKSWRDLRYQLTRTLPLNTVFSLVNVWSGNYFHWTLEGLTRLYFLQLYKDITSQSPKLLIDPQAPQWMKDSLTLLGYAAEDIIEWDATYARADCVLVASTPTVNGQRSPSAVRWVKTKILQSLGEKMSRVNSPYIYISRRNSKRRRIINEEALLELFTKYDIQAFELENLSFSEQVHLFSQASLIIGPHGAGFSNAIYSDKATLIEFFEQNYINPCFYRMAQALDLNYYYLVGETVQSDILMDIGEVDKLLSKLFG
jgi:hypothetical protein